MAQEITIRMPARKPSTMFEARSAGVLRIVGAAANTEY